MVTRWIALLGGALSPSRMTTPGHNLRALLEQRGITQQDLAAKLRVKWLTVHRWTKDDGFNEANQRRVCQELGLDPDTFSSPDLTAIKEEARARVFGMFLATDIGRSLSANERMTLERFQVFGGTPTVALYQAVLLGLRGLISRDEFEDSVSENEALDEELAKRR